MKAVKKEKIQHIACRSDRPCGANKAKLIMKQQRPGGGWVLRYRCMNCGLPFTISN